MILFIISSGGKGATIMGLFSDIKAVKEIQRIKKGGETSLSISQIVNLIINLPDAKRNLSSDEYDAVFSLYQKMRSARTQMTLNIDEYYSVAVDLIKQFDVIAPYEKYSGGNEIETSLLMSQIRDKKLARINEIKEKVLELDQQILQLESDYSDSKRFLYGAYTKEELDTLVNEKKLSKYDEAQYLTKKETLQSQVNCYPFMKNGKLQMRERLINELKALESELNM